MREDSNILQFPKTIDAKLIEVLDAHDQDDDVSALEKCLLLIDEGCTEAYVFAGAFYEKGSKGIDVDFSKARFYYERSIEECGAVEAYLGLARIYYYGRGVEVDHCKALSFYERVVNETDNAVASLMLGRIYEQGLCLERNLEKAKEYYQRAWDAGHVLGLTHLGLIEQKTGNYLRGILLRIRAGYLGFKTAVKNPYDWRLRSS